MDFKQLEAFVQVVKEESFSKAAHKVFLSQPTISAHISSLEKELGVQLLVRSTKAVYPTKEGLKLLGYAEDILALRQQAVHWVSGGGQLEGQVDILSSSVPAQYLLPEVLTAFYKAHPKVMVRVHQATSQKVMEGLDGWEYDFGIVGAPASTRKFHSRSFYKDQLVLIGPKEEVKEDRALEELKGWLLGHPFVLSLEGSGTRKGTQNLLATWGLSIENLTIAAFFSDNQSVIHSVSKGMGLSFVSRRAAALYEDLNLITVYPLQEAESYRFFSMIYLKELVLTPLVKELIDFIQGYYS